MDKKQMIQTLALNIVYSRVGIPALYPSLREKLQVFTAHMDTFKRPVYVVSTFRSWKEQDDLYAKGRTVPGSIVTNARGGESYHNYGLAFDFAFKDYNWNPPANTWWDNAGDFGNKLGLLWGGEFGDPGHFEYHPTPDSNWENLKDYIEVIRDIELAESAVERITLTLKKFFM